MHMLSYSRRLGHRFQLPIVFFLASNRQKQTRLRLASSSMSVPVVPVASSDWCCIASINKDSGSVTLNKITGYGESADHPFRVIDDQCLDITTSPDWMEFIERTEDRMNDEGGAGAYDTLRCDLILHSSDPENKWRVWGKPFHVKRLQNSYLSLVNHGQQDASKRTPETEEAIAAACDLSNSIFYALLSQAESSQLLNTSTEEPSPSWHQNKYVQLLRVTLLWSPSRDADSHDIVVRGHVCCNAKPLQVHKPVEPITVTIAAIAHEQEQVTVDASLPTRCRDPQNKVASWTRLRKTFENPEKYKPPGVSEVLMVRQSKTSSDLEVLEGISSNLFVIYKDGTIRTAQDGVLYGYVRHLVLECAEACGLRLDPRPILLHDASEGLWQEAFITSSSRLIFPIAHVLVFDEDQKDFTEFWHDAALAESACPAERPKWRQLLDDILNHGGYPL